MDTRIVDVISAPLDYGANIRGASLAPDVIALAGFFSHLKSLHRDVRDLGPIPLPHRRELTSKDKNEHFRTVILHACESLSKHVMSSLDDGHVALTLGGDHSIAIGSIAGSSAWCKKSNKKMGLIWIDAHADINTDDTTRTGNIHGMPLAVCLGLGGKDLTSVAFPGPKIHPECTALIGIRDLDEAEKRLCLDSGIHLYPMDEIDSKGFAFVINDVVEKILEKVDVVHVSFDLDGLDPTYAPGVSTSAPGGLSIREVRQLFTTIADSGKLLAADIVELNPLRDVNGLTAQHAIHLTATLLGSNILTESFLATRKVSSLEFQHHA